ncbi:MAG: DNA-directed RNA polymerase subunit B, partial [Candidatus Woesearchaeota archaeon]
MTEVYLNGKFVGDVESPEDFIRHIKSERRKGLITQNLNVYYDKRLERIEVEAGHGRVRRPLIVVRDGQPLLTEKHIKQLEAGEIKWSDLIRQGVIEYLDASEEEDALVAFSPKELTPEHTHLEITPLAMLGLVTSLVPYANFIMPVRLIIGSKNLRQSIGFYTANYPLRMDMDIGLLHYPQVPIVKTAMHDISHYERYPAGQNIVIAVIGYEGYNMEDAIVINKGSIQRGFGRSTYF